MDVDTDFERIQLLDRGVPIPVYCPFPQHECIDTLVSRAIPRPERVESIRLKAGIANCSWQRIVGLKSAKKLLKVIGYPGLHCAAV